jgi:hypothetical protein
LNSTAQNILRTLGYFDLFQYPLTKDELRLFHSDYTSAETIDMGLEILINDNRVYRIDEFYSLHNNYALVQRRRNGNRMAIEQIKTASRVARLLAKFPYVRGVAVSGSLSKNFASEKTDIDFFIITEGGRLWIARTFMHLYKKLTYLTGRQDWFCMNYYVDEAAPEITEKNIFTAMETVTLLPMQGKKGIDRFIAGNEWVKEYFPVRKIYTAGIPEIRQGFFGKLIEKIFNGNLGNRIDNWLMRVTEKRWLKKTTSKKLNSNGIRMGMVVGRHVSKPDPKNFQEKIIEQYRQKIQQLLAGQGKTEPVAI